MAFAAASGSVDQAWDPELHLVFLEPSLKLRRVIVGHQMALHVLTDSRQRHQTLPVVCVHALELLHLVHAQAQAIRHLPQDSAVEAEADRLDSSQRETDAGSLNFRVRDPDAFRIQPRDASILVLAFTYTHGPLPRHALGQACASEPSAHILRSLT